VFCGITVSCVDPLFLYLPVIKQDDKCLTLDKRLMVTTLCLRLVFDMIYVENIILGYFSRRHGRIGIVDPYHRQPRQIIKRYLRLYFGIDVLVILPILQVRESFMLLNLFFFFFCEFYFILFIFFFFQV
jgi:cyclic nucleotide gated channel